MFNWSRRTGSLGVAGLAAIVAVLVIAAAAVAVLRSGSSPRSYYLALGDSLSVGIQPNASGEGVITHQGYVDDLYAHLGTQIPGLALVQMGCPGDTTANVLRGGNDGAARLYHCDRHGGTQLQAALDFIHHHRRQVKVISIDIGANDVNGCINSTVFAGGLGALISCINQGEHAVTVNLPKILTALRSAAAPGTALVAGTYYDPYLADLIANNPEMTTLAKRSLAMITRVNDEVNYADAAAGFSTADVADAFSTYDTARVPSRSLGGRVPKDLVVVCADTWMCAKAPRGPNVHANPAGYRMIARAFEAALPRSL